MALEIERKFLVKDLSFVEQSSAVLGFVQFYLSTRVDSVVRVRIRREADGKSSAVLTVKGRNHGLVRDEWEYPIPVEDALAMEPLAVGRVIDKDRYLVPGDNGLTWEVDVFHNTLEGLRVAEVELPDADFPVKIPSFLGREVTGQPEYYNSSLASDSSLVPAFQ